MAIATASRDSNAAREAAATETVRRRDEDRQLNLVETLIAAVEMHNLSGRRDLPSDLRSDVYDATTKIGLRPPRGLWRVSTSSRLHEALLEWQGALLDAFRAHRIEYDDRFDERLRTSASPRRAA